MRILTMLTGILFMGAGIFLIANSGITFLSAAFPTGLAFMIAGVVECLSYSSYRGDNEERTWILIDGTTTFMLGFRPCWVCGSSRQVSAISCVHGKESRSASMISMIIW